MALGGIVCGLFSYQAVASDYSANLRTTSTESRQSSAPQDLAAEFGRGDLLQHQFDCSVSGCRNGGLAKSRGLSTWLEGGFHQWVLPPDGHTVLMPVELHTTPVTSRWQGDPSGVGFAHPPSPCLRNSTLVTQCSSTCNLLSSTQWGSI